ncbi:MAG TPA: hypothetical protein VF868_04725 [Bacteroidia bacterium]|jgi:hypothetical protein
MRTINTLAELREERQRLYMRKVFLETEIKKDFSEIKESLKPMNILASHDNSIVGSSAGFLAEKLIKNVVLRNSGFITRLIVPFLAKNVASNLAEDNKPKITHWITDLIEKFTHKKAEAGINH